MSENIHRECEQHAWIGHLPTHLYENNIICLRKGRYTFGPPFDGPPSYTRTHLRIEPTTTTTSPHVPIDPVKHRTPPSLPFIKHIGQKACPICPMPPSPKPAQWLSPRAGTRRPRQIYKSITWINPCLGFGTYIPPFVDLHIYIDNIFVSLLNIYIYMYGHRGPYTNSTGSSSPPSRQNLSSCNIASPPAWPCRNILAACLCSKVGT